jgi:hypothetical protein
MVGRVRGEGGRGARRVRQWKKFARVSGTIQFAEMRANKRKVRGVKKSFRLTSRNTHRSNCDFENGFTFANKPNLYGVI